MANTLGDHCAALLTTRRTWRAHRYELTAPLDALRLADLEAWLSLLTGVVWPREPLFRSNRGTAVSYNALHYQWAKLCIRAGLVDADDAPGGRLPAPRLPSAPVYRLHDTGYGHHCRDLRRGAGRRPGTVDEPAIVARVPRSGPRRLACVPLLVPCDGYGPASR